VKYCADLVVFDNSVNLQNAVAAFERSMIKPKSSRLSTIGGHHTGLLADREAQMDSGITG